VISPLKSQRPSRRVSITHSKLPIQRVSTSLHKSISRPKETITRSSIRKSAATCCPCKTQKVKDEYDEVERKHCPMCNSLLIKKTRSPIRKSVESRLRNLGTFGETNVQSVSLDTMLRASAREGLFEQNMVKSPKK
jgi:uncharacterized protein with PIN domain